MTKDRFNILLNKWLNNEISEEEKKELQAHPDFHLMKKITDEVSDWELPKSTVKPEEIATKAKKSKVVKMKFVKTLSIAASIAILIAAWNWNSLFSTETVYTTESNEVKTFMLPDSTEVTLNSNSTLAFKANDFEQNKREVSFTGQAYFDVTKKGRFSVNFDQGLVEVLGTEFEVLSTEKYQRVKCHEGKVYTKFKNCEDTLIVGDKFDSENMKSAFKTSNTSVGVGWKQKHIVFHKASLMEVIASLEVSYQIDIDYSGVDASKIYSGRYSKSNLKSALNTVFKPLEIEYSRVGDLIILK